MWLVAQSSLSWVCWDVRKLGSCVFCCLSSRNRISLELCHLLLAGRKNHHHDGSQFFMKVSCEFHLKFLSAYCSILESSFEAILVELTLLLDFLMVVWFVPLVVSVEDWFFQVNDVSVCSPVAYSSWVSNTGRGAPGRKESVLSPASKLRWLSLLG